MPSCSVSAGKSAISLSVRRLSANGPYATTRVNWTAAAAGLPHSLPRSIGTIRTRAAGSLHAAQSDATRTARVITDHMILSAAMPELPTTFGKYYLTEKLATGGMAEIYLAKLIGPGGFEKQLVIKQIPPNLTGQRHFVDLFVAEAKLLVSLAHGNIVPVY